MDRSAGEQQKLWHVIELLYWIPRRYMARRRGRHLHPLATDTDWRWAMSGRALVGWLLVGRGLFNLVEGIVDHHVLAIHHVPEGCNETAWDLAFLAFGALLVIGGRLPARSGEPDLPSLPS